MDQWIKTGTVTNSLLNKSKDTQSEEICLPSTSKDNQKALTQVSEYTQPIITKRQDEGTASSVTKKRKYLDEYLKYGFSFVGDDDCPRPQCVVCGELLANSSMKPSLLTRHLRTKHANYENKDRSFFSVF